MAVHEGLPVYPLTVKTAGVASEALAVAGRAVPLAQERDTVTEAGLLSEKSLLTVKLSVAVLVIVQEPTVTRAAEQVPEEA